MDNNKFDFDRLESEMEQFKHDERLAWLKRKAKANPPKPMSKKDYKAMVASEADHCHRLDSDKISLETALDRDPNFIGVFQGMQKMKDEYNNQDNNSQH